MEVGNNLGVRTPAQIYELARIGDAASQVAWAICLKRGRGVRRDANAALEWLQKAADQNYPEAFYQLAKCAETGIGLPQSDSTATEYYKKAASLGYKEAQYAYAMCLLGGIGCTYNSEEAEKWLKRASDEGFAPATSYLSTMSNSEVSVYSVTKEEQFTQETEKAEAEQLSDKAPEMEETDSDETTDTVDILTAREPEYEEKPNVDIEHSKDRRDIARALSDIRGMNDLIEKEGPGYVNKLVNKRYESTASEDVSTDMQTKVDAQEVQNTTAAAANNPNTTVTPRRSGVVFMIVMAVAGCVSGGLLKNTFGQNAANVHFSNSGDYTAFMALFGGVIGLLIALLLKKTYVNAKDGLPFYGLVLLLPLIIFLLSAASLELLIALWNITVGLVKLALTILVAVIIFAIVIYFLGS